jgi:hypothetical protein
MKFLNSLTVKEPRSSQLRALPQSSSPSPPLSRSRVQHSSANVIRTFFQTIKHKATNQRGGNNKLSPSTEEDDVIYIPTFRKHERSRGRALIKTIGNKTASMFKRQKIPSFEILYRNDGDIAIVDTKYVDISLFLSILSPPTLANKNVCYILTTPIARTKLKSLMHPKLEKRASIKPPTHLCPRLCISTQVQQWAPRIKRLSRFPLALWLRSLIIHPLAM